MVQYDSTYTYVPNFEHILSKLDIRKKKLLPFCQPLFAVFSKGTEDRVKIRTSANVYSKQMLPNLYIRFPSSFPGGRVYYKMYKCKKERYNRFIRITLFYC